MKTPRPRTTVLAAGLLLGVWVAHAQAAPLVIETVAVGNPGNAGEQPRLQCCNDPRSYGAVAYTFWIGRYEVTAGQYTAFLNAVAATDAHGLYNTNMSTQATGCKIERSGSPGSYTYSVAPDQANRPVNYVSWADAARFANWMHNGQPTGAQGPMTTEDGAYFINGINEFNDGALEDVLREPDPVWAIASEDEWYKAAYHENDGATGNYWSYPTGADSGVSNLLVDPDPGNHATFRAGAVFTIGAPYYRTEVGAHESSASPYGTFDQGGNVMEFTEAVPEPDIRRMRGGAWDMAGSQMTAREFDDVMHSSDQFDNLGFRLVTLVEPATTTPPILTPAVSDPGRLTMVVGMAAAGALLLRRRRSRAGWPDLSACRAGCGAA